ncbi:Pycsar system effector family protein [Streptomyces harbinensis]|uniref:Pycsar system effector family protein n=1 Tax=Streptomyces harbinensis TaxID=1176198 RepID=UPI00371E11DC
MNAEISARLDAALATAVAQQGRADSKAATLLTLDSILVAGFSAMAGQMPTAAWPVAAAAVAALIVSATLAILVIRPNLGGTDRGSFIHWSLIDTDEVLVESLREDHRPAHLRVMARITLKKMQLVRRSGLASLLALGLLAVAALVTVLV